MATEAKIRITAQDDSAAAFKKATANLDSLKASAVRLGAALGGTLAVGGLTALVSSAIDAADKLKDLSQQTGISVESLGGLGFAASQSGGNLESITAAAGKLNKSLAEAAAGGREALEPFNALGISVKDAAGQTKAADVVFAELADKFKGFNDGPEKSALALKLFGKAGAEQIALLNEGGDALRANIDYYKRFSGVTTEVAQASDQFNDTLGKVKLISGSLGTTIAASLLPSLQAVADRLLLLKETGSGFAGIAEGIKFAFDAIALSAASVSLALNIAGLKIGGYFAQLAAVGRGSLTQFTAISDAVKADVERAKTEFKIFGNQILGRGASSPDDQSAAESRRLGLIGSSTKGPAPRLSGGGAGKAKKDEISEASRALATYVESLSRELEKTDELTASEKALNFLRSQGAAGQIPQVRELVLGLAAQVDKEKELAEVLKLKRQIAIDAGDAVAKSNEEYQALLSRLLAATPTAKLDEQRKDVQILTDEFEAGRLAETLYLEAVSARLDLTNEKVTQTKSLAEDLGLTFASAFEDAVVGGKNFSDVLKGLEKDILRIVTRKLVTEPLGNALTGALGGSGGGGGGIGGALSGIFGKLFSFDGGGFTGGGTRTGGLDGKGGFMAVMHPQERVIDYAKGQSGGNTVHVSITQQFAPGTTQQTTLQAATAARRQLEAAGRNL